MCLINIILVFFDDSCKSEDVIMGVVDEEKVFEISFGNLLVLEVNFIRSVVVLLKFVD